MHGPKRQSLRHFVKYSSVPGGQLVAGMIGCASGGTGDVHCAGGIHHGSSAEIAEFRLSRYH
jgi:hypothetical protein